MSVSSELSKLWRIMTDPVYRAFRQDYKAFRTAHGRGTPDTYTGLLPGDVVLDIGGYHGDWADAMAARYAIKVHVFEPHPRFAAMIDQRFVGRSDVMAHGFDELGLTKVVAAKINIEGGEYDLLPALIDTKLIDRFDRITVQFHKFSEGDRTRRDDIRRALAETHDCVWCYPFIWEEWHHKGLGV